MKSRSGWRADVLALYGAECVARSLDCDGRLEAHHLVYRSRGGGDVPENGVPLCTIHHGRVHAGRLQIDPGWLAPQAVDWLAEVGAVAWDEAGDPAGRHWRSFAPRR